jgi:ribonuclease BN (tRNA processing enzyme)
MNIRILGAHNCESRNTRSTSILIDDVLAVDAGGLVNSLSFRAQLKVKAILITHHHYDHTGDIPSIAMNLFLNSKSINIYSTMAVYSALTKYLMNNELYLNFMERPPENPTIKFTMIKPHDTVKIEDYAVLAVPISHSVPTVGYQVTANGKTVFYTGDTGPGLADCWQYVSPQLLIVEVTASNRYEEFARESKHLTPDLLKQELNSFRSLKGYLPPVVTVHMNPWLEKEIRAEIDAVAESLNAAITPAHEGMQLHL